MEPKAVPVLIKPVVGRVVWFFPAPHFSVAGAPGPLAATIVHVHSDRMINVAVYDSNGKQFAETSVTLVQPGDEVYTGANRCEWMPFQQGQAAKTDEAARNLERLLQQTPTTAGRATVDAVGSVDSCRVNTVSSDKTPRQEAAAQEEAKLKAVAEGRDVAANPGKDIGTKPADEAKSDDPPETPASSWVKK